MQSPTFHDAEGALLRNSGSIIHPMMRIPNSAQKLSAECFVNDILLLRERGDEDLFAWVSGFDYANCLAHACALSLDCAALLPVMERPFSIVALLHTFFRCFSEPPMPEPSFVQKGAMRLPLMS